MPIEEPRRTEERGRGRGRPPRGAGQATRPRGGTDRSNDSGRGTMPRERAPGPPVPKRPKDDGYLSPRDLPIRGRANPAFSPDEPSSEEGVYERLSAMDLNPPDLVVDSQPANTVGSRRDNQRHTNPRYKRNDSAKGGAPRRGPRRGDRPPSNRRRHTEGDTNQETGSGRKSTPSVTSSLYSYLKTHDEEGNDWGDDWEDSEDDYDELDEYLVGDDGGSESEDEHDYYNTSTISNRSVPGYENAEAWIEDDSSHVEPQGSLRLQESNSNTDGGRETRERSDSRSRQSESGL